MSVIRQFASIFVACLQSFRCSTKQQIRRPRCLCIARSCRAYERQALLVVQSSTNQREKSSESCTSTRYPLARNAEQPAKAYGTICSAIFSMNLPKLVPPNFATIHCSSSEAWLSVELMAADESIHSSQGYFPIWSNGYYILFKGG